MENGNDRQVLLLKIQMLGFSLVDLNLYLDYQPTDTAALAKYQQQAVLYQSLSSANKEQYGPLTAPDVHNMEYWTWVDTPWPWEMEA